MSPKTSPLFPEEAPPGRRILYASPRNSPKVSCAGSDIEKIMKTLRYLTENTFISRNERHEPTGEVFSRYVFPVNSQLFCPLVAGYIRLLLRVTASGNLGYHVAGLPCGIATLPTR